MFLWEVIETLQHKNEEAARVSRELADEEVEKHQEQLSSLEELQKKLVSTGGDKQALAQIQSELNDAIGETPGLLNDEANAYESATKKLWAKIEAEKAALKAAKSRQIESARDQFNSNVGNISYTPWDFSAEDMRAIAWDSSYSEVSATHFLAKRQQGNGNVHYGQISKEEWANFWKEQVEYAKISWEDVVSEYSGTGGKSFAEGILETLVTSGYGDKDIDRLLPQLLDNDEFTKAIDEYLSSLSDPNKNSDSAKKNVEQFIESLSNQFPKLNKFLDDYWYNLVSGSENAEDSIDNFIENYEAKLKSLNEELDKIQSAYQTVASAIEEYNENGYLSVDTYQKLLELAPEYMSMLMDENGNLTLTKESWRLLTEAKIRDMYQTQANQYIESIKAAADSGNLEQLDKLTQGYKNLAEAKVINYKATLATLNLTDEQRAGAEAYLSGLEKAMNQTIAGLGKGGMGGGSNTAKKQEDLAKQIREKEKQIEEAWEKERLEQLKDDLEKRKNEIEKYKNYIETLDFGLDILDSSDYSGQIDLLEQKFDNLVTYGQQLRQEFERVSQLTPETADEAQAIASRVQEIGSEMRNNVKTLRETQTELLKAPILFLTNASSKYINDISSGVERIRWQLEEMTKPYNKDNDFLNRLLPFDMLFPDLNEYDAALSEKAKHDKALIAEEQKTQDTINKIVTDALEKQSEENAKARAEERTKLQEELDEISKEYKSALDTASKNTSETQKKISNEFNNISNSAGTMQQNVDTHFGNMETSVTTHVDNTIKKIDELKDKITKFNPLSYDPNQELMSKLPSNNNAGGIGGAVAPAMTRQSSSYGNRIHPIYGTKKFHDGIDLAAPGGSPVLAYSQGTVTYAGWNGGYGNYVAIDHGNGYTTFYGHMSKINVSKGQTVSKGTRIGSVGTTGNSTGNHLHFGAKYNGSSVNPNKLFPAFSKGTNFHSGGELVLGEDGKELVIYPNGTAEIVGENGTEMRDLPRGTKVIPNEETEKILKDKKKDDGTYDIDFSQYSAFNVKNLPDTIKTIDKDNQWIRGQIELRYDERANAINYDFKTGKINKNQLSEAQNGLIDYLINGDEKNSGLKKMAEDALDDATNLLKAYNDAVTLDPTLANNETREALVQMQNDAWDYYESIMQMEQESYDFKVQKQEDYAEARKLWWDRDLEALDYEEYVRQRIISDLEKEIDLTDDYTKKLILRNKLTKEYNDTIAYSDANEKAKRNILIEQTNELLDYIKDNNLGLDISGWFDKDGNLTDKYAFDTQNLVDTEFYPFINGYVQAMANTYASINDTNEKRANAIAENLNLDKQRIEDLKTSLQKVMDDEKDYMNDKITYYNSLNSLLAKYYSVTNSITEAHHNINKELKAAQTSYKYLDAQTRLLLFNENDYVALTKELNDIQSKANRLKSQYEYDLLHAQKEDIAEITNNYERQYDLLMKQYEISKAKLEVEKKRIQLDNVLNERNVRMFVNGQWQWVANTQDVIDAQNELEDAKYNESKAGTELTQTQSLNNLSASAD